MTNIDLYDYYCPKCNNMLSDGDYVVFDIIRTNNEKAKLFLSPKPGSYEFKCVPPLNFNKEELVDFCCPKCNQNLSSNKYNKFVQILLKITDKVFIDVFFSRIYGVHKTYVGIEDFEEEFGSAIRKH